MIKYIKARHWAVGILIVILVSLYLFAVEYDNQPIIITTATESPIEITGYHDGIMALEVTNTSAYVGNVVASMVRFNSDTGSRMSVGILNSGTSIGTDLQDVGFLYNYGLSDMAFFNDGAVDFNWYSDPTDSHDYSAATNKIMKLDTAGALTTTTPVVGQMYGHGSPGSITVTTGGTFYGFTGFTEGIVAGSGYITTDTADTTADHFIIGANGAGTYFCSISASYYEGKDAITSCHVYINTTQQPQVTWNLTMKTENQLSPASGSGLLVLSAGDEVSLRCTSDGSADVLVFESASMTIYRVN